MNAPTAHAPTGQSLRYELKFVVSPIDLARIELGVRLHPFAFRSAYVDRQVNNIYFDSSELDAYTQNLAGVGHREKVRFRWYGDSALPAGGVLEAKIKRGMLGWKESFPIRDIPLEAADDWRVFLRILKSQLPPAARMKLERFPLPVLINTYRRSYFVSRDDRVRVTIDSDLRILSQLRTTKPNVGRRTLLPDVCVIEVKADAEHRDLVRDVLQVIPARVSRFSKYCMGVQSFDC